MVTVCRSDGFNTELGTLEMTMRARTGVNWSVAKLMPITESTMANLCTMLTRFQFLNHSMILSQLPAREWQ